VILSDIWDSFALPKVLLFVRLPTRSTLLKWNYLVDGVVDVLPSRNNGSFILCVRLTIRVWYKVFKWLDIFLIIVLIDIFISMKHEYKYGLKVKHPIYFVHNCYMVRKRKAQLAHDAWDGGIIFLK